MTSPNRVTLDNGRITLINGDCLEILPKIKPNCIDALVTDPPYKLVSGGVSGQMTGGIFDPSVYNNNGSIVPTIPFKAWLGPVARCLKHDSDQYIMCNAANLNELLNAALREGYKLHNILVWDKGNVTPNRWYMKACEFTAYFWRGTARNINNMGSSTIQRIANPTNKRHPTEKPVELMTHYIANSTQVNDIVLDPFAGVGTTAVACIKTHRRCIAIEMDTTLGYFDAMVKRCEDAIIERDKNHVMG